MQRQTDPYSDYAVPVQAEPTAKERKTEAETTSAEAVARYAAQKAEADARKAEADALRSQLGVTSAQQELEEAGALEASAETGKTETAMRKRAQLSGFLEDIQRARNLLSNPLATGIGAQITGSVFGSPYQDLNSLITAIQSPIVLEAMQEARKGSKAGATGFGALSEKEMRLLASNLGSLSTTQSPEVLQRTLDRIEENWRRLLAYNAGYDPDKPEGAALAGLALPKGTEEPSEPIGGELTAGEWAKNPELRGVDAAVLSMIKAGRSAGEVRQWLNEYQQGLGDKAVNVEENVNYWRKTRKNPNVTIERQFVPAGEAPLTSMGTGAFGAFNVGAGEQLSQGFLDELSGERERAAAVMRGMQEEHPGAYGLGQLWGGTVSSLIPEGLAVRYGVAVPRLLQGIGQNILYGAGSAEPGDRVSGAVYGGLITPFVNLAGGTAAKVFGAPLRGGAEKLARLADEYNINLTPGQILGDSATERRLSGLPIVGPQIRARRNETLDQFNRAAFDDALAPIGAKTSQVGQAGVGEAQTAVSDAYKEALDGITMQLDTPFVRNARGRAYSELGKLADIGPELKQQVDDIFKRYVGPDATLTGENLQNALQELQELKRSYFADPRWKRRIAPQIDEISDAFSGVLQRQFPENYRMFRNANTAHRNVSVLENAVENAAEGDIFNPSNLRRATRQGTTRFGGRKASARGDRPFNELVMSAEKVVPSRYDDTSLSGQLLSPALGAGAGAGYYGVNQLLGPETPVQEGEGGGPIPAWMLYGLGGAGLASLPYSRSGTRIMTSALRGDRTAGQQKLGNLIEQYLPAFGRGIYRGATSEPGVPSPQNQDVLLDKQTEQLINQMQFAPQAPEQQSAFPEEVIDQATGRPMAYNPDTKRYFYTDTGEEVPGYAHGGLAHALGGY